MYFHVSSLGITIMASISTVRLPNLIHMLYQMGFWKRMYLFIQQGCLLSNAKLYIMFIAQIICYSIRGNGALGRATSDCCTSLPVFQLIWLMLDCLEVWNKWLSLNFSNIKHFVTQGSVCCATQKIMHELPQQRARVKNIPEVCFFLIFLLFTFQFVKKWCHELCSPS